jgi:hypothetical protein
VFLANVDEIDPTRLPRNVRIISSVVYFKNEYYVYQPETLLNKDLIKYSSNLACHIMSQAERYLNFDNNRYIKNEFKAGDFIKFGRVCYHVRETSEDPIILSENEVSPVAGEENKSMLDNTNAEAANLYNTGDLNGTLRPNLSAQNRREVRSDGSPRSPSFLRAPDSVQRTRRIISTTMTQNNESRTDMQSEKSRDIKTEPKEQFTCRICLCDGDVEDELNKGNIENALISPCSCSGNIDPKYAYRYDEIYPLHVP